MSPASALVDAAGTRHAPAAPDARIVSLVPSITELVCDLGLAGQLVGRTGFCVHPRETVKRIPKVGGTKDVDLGKLRALSPTHVIVNIDENRRETAAALERLVPHLVVTHPLSPLDNPALYRLIGGLFGREQQAQALCGRFESALAALQQRAASFEPQEVLYLVWKRPWMTVSRDTYISRMLELVRWHTLPAEAAARYPEVALEGDLLSHAQAVLLSTEPYPFREHDLAEVRGLASLRDGKVALIDGEMTSWYGSRAIAGLEYLGGFRESLQAGSIVP